MKPSVIGHSNMSKSSFVVLFALVALAGLSGCSSSSAPPQPAAQSQSAASVNAAQPATKSEAPAVPGTRTASDRTQETGVAAADSNAPQSKSGPVHKPVAVQLPSSAFVPTPNDVLGAFAQTLADTAVRMKASSQRDSWYRSQVLLLKTLRVGKCTKSSPGTVSVCPVVLNHKRFTAYLLLTQEGWRLTNPPSSGKKTP